MAEYRVAERRLVIAAGLTIVIFAIEVAGGLISNSLALLSDAGHAFIDVLALLLGWFGVRQAERASTPRMTYGYHRVGVLIAIVNALTLVVIVGGILYEAYRRFQAPPPVQGISMLVVAAIGLGVNISVIFMLKAHQKENLTVRSAFFHVLGDTVSSIGVVIGGVIISFTGLLWVDPAISLFIAFIIALSAWGILREGLAIFLEASPKNINMNSLVEDLSSIPEVKGIHDLHVWSITPGLSALTCHVLIEDLPASRMMLMQRQISDLLLTKFNIQHTTIQFECEACDPSTTFCILPHGKHQQQ